MRIAGVGSAFPEHYFPQEQVASELKREWADKLPNPAAMDRLFKNTGVDGRYFALPLEDYRTLDTWGKANNQWIKTAEELGEVAICRAVTHAGISLEDLGAIFVVSVTGIASPSLDARLMNRMALPRDIKRIPIFGLGCVAGAAGIARAADYVKAYPDQAAILLSVELCSLTWQRNDLSIANMISCGLFGDGAAAVVITGNHDASGPEILASRSSFYSGTEDVMGWDISEKGFSIVLSAQVPNVITRNLGRDVDGFLASHDLTRKDIDSWIMHTGGPKVLEATAAALNLPNNALDASWESLKKVGNLSSASVLLVLEDFMKKRRPSPESYSVLAAMGPGFCSEAVLLRW